MAEDMSNMKIHVSHLRKCFGKLEVLKDINADIRPGEVVVIIGLRLRSSQQPGLSRPHSKS